MRTINDIISELKEMRAYAQKNIAFYQKRIDMMVQDAANISVRDLNDILRMIRFYQLDIERYDTDIRVLSNYAD